MALIKERTKKRKGENAIGKIIYGFLIFAPLLSILVTCLYVIINKNAYLNYSDEYVYQTAQIYNNQVPPNTEVVFKYANTSGVNANSPVFTYSKINIDWSDYSAYANNQVNGFRFYNDQSGNVKSQISLYYDGSFVGNTRGVWGSDLLEFTTTITEVQAGVVTMPQYTLYVYTYLNNPLDNAFDYATTKVEKSTLYNWAKNTGTYEVLETTTTGLGITNTFIPLLMAYWLLISVIYFIFDIALILIWMVHDKIHELKDSISL